MKIKPDYFEWFLSMPVPRQVEKSLLDNILDFYIPKFNRVVFYILPFLIFTVSSFALGTIISSGNYKDELRLLKGPTAFTQGKIFSVTETKGSKGKIQYLYEYTYQTPGREEVTGISFSSKPLGTREQDIEIEYLVDNPKISCMKGAHLNPAPMMIVVIIPFVTLIGAGIPFFILKWRKKWILIVLQDGIKTTATILNIKRGQKGTRNIDLLFYLEGREINSRVNVPGRKQDVELLESFKNQNMQVAILVDPKKTKRLIIIDTLFLTY